MRTNFILLSFSLVLLSCTSHTVKVKDSTLEIVSPPDLNPNKYDAIGFACGSDGNGTALVNEFTLLIKDKNYKQLRSSLYSSKPGEVYLATISCENLAKEGMIKLNVEEQKQIVNNRNKTDTIYTCAGCTEFDFFTVKQLLNDTTNYIHQRAGWWFDDILGKHIIEE